MRPIVFREPGKIVLVRYNVDGTLTYDSTNIISNIGKITSIAPSVTQNTSTLTDGNSDWPMYFDTSKAGQITVTMATFQPRLYAALMGTETTTKTTDTLWATDEGYVIPANGTVKLAHTPKTNGALVVVGEDDTVFTVAETTPATGTYTITDGTITFAAADAGKAVYVTYEWNAADAVNLGMPERGSRPALHAIISGTVESDDGVAKYDVNIIIDKCKATGDLAQPSMQQEPQSWSFTLQVLQPRPGMKAVGYKFVPVATEEGGAE